jgi:hypothetical protein
MRLPDDEEIHDVDGTYLGPEGKFIGRLRYRALVLGPVVFVMGLLVVAQTVGYSLLSVGALCILAPWATGRVIDHTSGERSFGVLVNTFIHEVDGRREPRGRMHAKGSGLRAGQIRLGGLLDLPPGRRSWRTYANREALRKREATS